ncbi:MAG: nickel-responsive transcriptional regulator NikR [Thermaerobacter sp.]|jgi:CopG family nickel-responsive transcriptional regulator|nr:nickel-responsive transcriptional regulator NikR [Thermaerobacter sp.]MDA8145944.1 nickel-responsive transcriptional regulator NikR [Thermaerobacter sp.]
MKKLVRFGVSMEEELLQRFDRLLEAKGYPNRSEALRDLVRSDLVEHDWESGQAEVAGTITLVYDHHKADLESWLTRTQHASHRLILATTHIHLDHDNCLEVLIVRGQPAQIRALANRLTGAKGVKHGRLTISTTGAGLA